MAWRIPARRSRPGCPPLKNLNWPRAYFNVRLMRSGMFSQRSAGRMYSRIANRRYAWNAKSPAPVMNAMVQMTVLSIEPPAPAPFQAPKSGVPIEAASDLTGDIPAMQSSLLRFARGFLARCQAAALVLGLASCSKAAQGPVVTVHSAAGDV